MTSQYDFTPSETILLNGFLFAESRDPLHAFALPLHGDEICADERGLAIIMLTAAFFANLDAGCLSIRKVEHKSVLQDDPYMVSFIDSCQWPKDTLEHSLLFSNSKPVALDLLSPLQADGALRKSKNVSHLKASNRRSKERGILLRNKDHVLFRYIIAVRPYLNCQSILLKTQTFSVIRQIPLELVNKSLET